MHVVRLTPDEGPRLHAIRLRALQNEAAVLFGRMKTIVTISGSSQPSSFTAKALAVVEDELRKSDFSVDTFDGARIQLDFPGRPATADAARMRAAVKSAAGLVLATPEYHGGMSALIKLCVENLGSPQP